jgi:hypothetical protein
VAATKPSQVGGRPAAHADDGVAAGNPAGGQLRPQRRRGVDVLGRLTRGHLRGVHLVSGIRQRPADRPRDLLRPSGAMIMTDVAVFPTRDGSSPSTPVPTMTS